MNKIKFFLVSLAMLFATSAFAVESVYQACTRYPPGTYVTNVRLMNYGFNTINSEVTVLLSAKSGVLPSNQWFIVKANNNGSYLYDLAKSAKFSGEPINACVDKNGYLLGLEWARSS